VPRPFIAVLNALVALAFSSLAAAATAVPIAPLPDFAGPTLYLDTVAQSASNGTSTLVVWSNQIGPTSTTERVLASLFDSEHDPLGHDQLGHDQPGMVIAAGGTQPLVASNGHDYLVAYEVLPARVQLFPYDNVFAQIVTAGGELGARRTISHAIHGSLSAVAWAGSRWLVGYNDTNGAQIAVLDESLELTATVELGAGQGTGIVNAGNTWWAFVQQEGFTRAVEIRSDGSTGVHYESDEPASGFVIANGRSALVFSPRWNNQVYEGIDVATFNPLKGFSARRPILTGAQIVSAEPWGSNILLLHRPDPFGSSTIDASVIDLEGHVLETKTLLENMTGDAGLGQSRNGLLLFQTDNLHVPGIPPPTLDLYAYHLDSLAPLDPATRELMSLENFAVQDGPLLASNGTSAVAFWSQTVDETRRQSAFSRVVKANGIPTGEPVLLPFNLGLAGWTDVAFDGRQFIIARSNGPVQAVAVSTDGKIAGPLVMLGNGAEVRVAGGPNGFFAVWRGNDAILGTPLADDATPLVPGGFAILPAPFGSQDAPSIAAVDGGFLVLWSEAGGVKRVMISPSGAVQSTATLSPSQTTGIVLAANGNTFLAAWITGEGPRLSTPEGDLDPQWGDWTPVDIVTLGDDRYLVAIRRGAGIHTSIVSLSGPSASGPSIVEISPLHLLGRFPLTRGGLAVAGGTPLVLFGDGRRVSIASDARFTRPRAVRH